MIFDEILHLRTVCHTIYIGKAEHRFRVQIQYSTSYRNGHNSFKYFTYLDINCNFVLFQL